MPTRPAQTPIKLGLLHSLTGCMSVSERLLLDAEMMAIDEINAAGGVLGRTLVPLVSDGASDPLLFARKTRELISEGVSSLFGCWTSASRKAVKDVVEFHDHLLWYPVQYEGLEESPNIVYTGSCVNQQIAPALEWLFAHHGLRVFLIGSDYVFPRTANKLIRTLSGLSSTATAIIGEEYFPLDCTDFEPAITAIKALRPSAVINTLNGASNLVFYQQFYDAGISPDEIPILAVSISEPEFTSLTKVASGHLACWNYFQSLDSDDNRRFLKRFRSRYGGNAACSASAVMAYSQIYLWKEAAEAAGSASPALVRQSLVGCAFDSPAGRLVISPNRHIPLLAHIARLKPDGEFEIFWSSDGAIAPLPWLGLENQDFPAVGIARGILAAYPETVDYSVRLNQEIAERRRAEHALHRLNETLEERVRERTAELMREIEQRRRSGEALRKSEEQLKKTLLIAQKLSQHMESTRENERRYMAREIHDELGQALTALKLDLFWLLDQISTDVAACGEKIESMIAIVSETVKSVQRISAELRPRLLDDLGMVAAIDWLAKGFMKRTGIQCTVTLDNVGNCTGTACATAIFRIFQETLTNITRHAEATRVSASLECTCGSAFLEVMDNGIGISAEQLAADDSFGLLGIRERAQMCGGEADITGLPGKGTTIRVTIPCSVNGVFSHENIVG